MLVIRCQAVKLFTKGRKKITDSCRNNKYFREAAKDLTQIYTHI